MTRTGELLSRLSEDTQIIKNAATSNLSEALRNVSTALIGLGFMLATSWKLTCKHLIIGLVVCERHFQESMVLITGFFIHLLLVLALVVVPAISVAVNQFGRFLREISHKTQAAAAAAASIAEVYSFN